MIDIILGFDEGIILESNGVTWISGEKTRLQQFILTNKNLFLIYKHSNGLFAKATDEVVQKPLSEIKIINGQPMVDQVKNDYYGVCLQIQFFQGRELFAFDEAARKNTVNWVNALWKVLVGTEAPAKQKTSPFDALGNFSGVSDGLGGLAVNFKSAAGTAMQSFSSVAKQVATKASTSYENAREQIQANRQKQIQKQDGIEQEQSTRSVPRPSGVFCSNCGARLDSGVRFCSSCGAPVGAMQSAMSLPPVPKKSENNEEVTKSGFTRAIDKCPNCGQVISGIDMVCPSCGYQITGRAASSSVQRLQDQLMAIENSRKQNSAIENLVQSVTGRSDNQEYYIHSKKVTLIKSFPIPNTIDEIVEFVILAAGNIDVSLSKVSLGNRLDWLGFDSNSGAREISDAWVGKLKQAFQKAELTFSDQPIFGKINEIYREKMIELNMLKKE